MPACTGTGFAELVTDRSAESATCTLTDALLLLGLGSLVVEVTESVWVMVVPDATLLFTVTTKVKVAVVFAAIAAGAVHLRLARGTHVHPDELLSATAVVFAGRVSVSTGALAGPGPLLVTVWV